MSRNGTEEYDQREPITEVLKRAAAALPPVEQRRAVVVMDALTTAIDAKRQGDTDLLAIANQIYQLRYGLLTRMAAEMRVDAQIIYEWAERKIIPATKQQEQEELNEPPEATGK